MELGRTYLRLQQPRQALAALERGRKRRPDPQFYIEMAAAWSSLGDPHRAAITLMEGLIVDTTYTRFATGLVDVYRQWDARGCALRDMGGQASVNLECPIVREDVCTASRNVVDFYMQVGQGARAAETARTAVSSLGCPAAMFR
jgi:hypothetical protein